ncbi:MAG: PEP-CTERM sorting domain-containing protein [Microcystis aeruginosa Ma_QC_C_20070823_S13]|nr:MAG: PEP-CTERM sorting domain-containing protein [Microcystis aeruginosa Ma_QC_C_20070823_S13]
MILSKVSWQFGHSIVSFKRASFRINAGSGNFLTGVVDKNNSTLSFTAASAATPEPGSVLGLLAMGGLGLVTLRKRQG